MIARFPFYYGWVILFAGAVGMVMTSPGQTYSVSIFIEHFIADLGISRSLVSTLYTVGTLGASFVLPFIGRKIDQHGSRNMMILIVIMLTIACIYMGSVQNIVMLCLGFVAIRLFGQSSLALVSSNVINQWWVRRRGMATGWSGLLMSLVGVGVFPLLIQRLITLYGWRVSYPLLGVIVITIMLPIAWVLVKDTPEQFGLLPDGLPLPTDEIATPIVEENWTRREAVRTPVFWLIAASGFSIAALSTGLYFHMVSIFADNNFSAEIAAAVYIPISISTAAFSLLTGYLADRVPERFLIALSLAMMALALVLAPQLSSLTLATIYGILLGGLGGLWWTVSSIVWANYFGRKHLGAITGSVRLILTAGTAAGPMPFGIARDLLGTYTTILNLSAIIPATLALLSLLFVYRPSR